MNTEASQVNVTSFPCRPQRPRHSWNDFLRLSSALFAHDSVFTDAFFHEPAHRRSRVWVKPVTSVQICGKHGSQMPSDHLIFFGVVLVLTLKPCPSDFGNIRNSGGFGKTHRIYGEVIAITPWSDHWSLLSEPSGSETTSRWRRLYLLNLRSDWPRGQRPHAAPWGRRASGEEPLRSFLSPVLTSAASRALPFTY